MQNATNLQPAEANRRVNLALFDFDGTITRKETYLDFIRFATGGRRLLAGKLALSPLIVGYRLGLVPARSIRAAIAWLAFAGVSSNTLARRGEEFARTTLPGLVRPRAQQQIDWHRQNGDRIVVVSAALDVYLNVWCRENGLDVICTQLQEKNGKITGRYVAGDCSGREKRMRILERYDLNEYAAVYAYGDTAEDNDMLSLAHRKFFRWSELASNPVAST